MQLFPHQKQALAWNDNRKGFALFMHMRLGKSLVAVRQCAKWGSNQVLLIAPMSTWFDWITLLESECQSVCVLEGTRADKQHFLQTQGNAFDWLIVNPQTIARWGKEFFEWLALCCSIDTCILDEATFIKNPKAKISKLLLKHREHFDRRIIMTGTPISDKTEDIVNLMIWVHDSFMECGNFYEWRTNYMSPARFGWRLKKGIKDYIKHELASKSFRLTAKEVGHYTTQIKRTYLVQMPTDIRTDYDELERNWCLGLGSTKYVVAKDIWLSQLASGIYAKQLGGKDNQFKLDAVVDIVSDVKDQFVIFSRWLREIYHLSTYLSLPCITGQTPFEERKRLIERFRQGEFRGIVLQPAVAARGLDLSAADTAICTSNVWGHEIRQQIEARLQHPLKRKPTEFIDIITKDSTDEVVYQLLMDKAINADSFMQKVMVKRKRKYL